MTSLPEASFAWFESSASVGVTVPSVPSAEVSRAMTDYRAVRVSIWRDNPPRLAPRYSHCSVRRQRTGAQFANPLSNWFVALILCESSFESYWWLSQTDVLRHPVVANIATNVQPPVSVNALNDANQTVSDLNECDFGGPTPNHSDYCRLFPDSADPGVGPYR